MTAEEAYSVPYVEPLGDAKTKLAGFTSWRKVAGGLGIEPR